MAIAGWPILNFAFFAKFRVGMLEAGPKPATPNGQHENANQRRKDFVQLSNFPTQSKSRLEWATSLSGVVLFARRAIRQEEPSMNSLKQMLWTIVTLFLIVGAAPLASAAELPADLCSLLPTAVVNKTLGDTYNGPDKSVAPRPFPNTATGTDCTYKSRRHSVVFRIYIDPSAQAATELFAKLKLYFGSGSTAVTGVGDEAYLDANHALHVRKGKARFYLDTAANEQQRKDLASGIAGQL